MQIHNAMLADLATGAAFLGSGGGGDPYYSLLLAEAALARCGAFELVALDTLPDDALVAPCGWIGAPTVSVEKLPSGKEAAAGLRRLEEIMGRKIDAVLPIEIGGGNGPFYTAAHVLSTGGGPSSDWIAAVPVPGAVWLMGSALGLLGWLRRKSIVAK